jgi:tetratricopeptide (TPR) repeat protein
MSELSLRSGRSQTPRLFEPAKAERLSPEAKAALQQMVGLLRSDTTDQRLQYAFDQAVALAPKQPDAWVLYALGLLKDNRRTLKAAEALEEVIAQFPDSVVANHALAWMHFKGKDYEKAVTCLATAIGNLPDGKSPYALHLCEFAGQLKAVAVEAVNAPNIDVRSVVTDAVAKLGDDAKEAYLAGYADARSNIKDYERQIRENPAESASLERRKNNIASYTSFDFGITERHLADAIEAP